MSLKEIEKLFSGSKYLSSLDEIALTGGEPFLRDDLYEIYRYFRHNYPSTTIIITTNGLLKNKLLMETELDTFWTIPVFSIDGLEKTNDSIRGIKGGFQKVLYNIEQYKKEYPSLKMGLSFTIVPENCYEIKEVYNLSVEKGLSFTMRFAAGSDQYYANEGLELRWTEELLKQAESDIEDIVKEISKTRNPLVKSLNPDTLFFSKMIRYERRKERLFTCYSGTHSLFLNPTGDVYSCIFSGKPIGNVRKDSLDNIWFSADAKKERQYIAKKECHCWTECESIPSLQRKVRISL